MYNVEFPHCCGFRVLYNFGYHNVPDVLDYIKCATRTTLDWNARLYNEGDDCTGRAGVLVALNGTQNNKLKDGLTKLGFTMVLEGRNRPHRSRCYLWVKSNETQEKEDVRNKK